MQPTKKKSPLRFLVWGLVIGLVILHQDNWLWSNPRLVFGFMPITLLYHAGISLAAGFVWFLATKFAWPHELAEAAPEPSREGDAA